MQNYKNLDVWQTAHLLAVNVYKATMTFPKEELYGLTSQIRRASVSIPSNIAEGCGRNGDPEFGRFLQFALGSSNELEYQLLLAYELKYLDDEIYKDITSQIDHTRRMLIALLKKMNDKESIKH